MTPRPKEAEKDPRCRNCGADLASAELYRATWATPICHACLPSYDGMAVLKEITESVDED